MSNTTVNVSKFQRPQASAPSEFFFSYFFTLIRVYRPPPSASARNHVHNPHLVSFSFSSFVGLIRVRSPRTRNTSARNRVSHPYPVGFSFVLSLFIHLLFLYPHPPTSTTIASARNCVHHPHPVSFFLPFFFLYPHLRLPPSASAHNASSRNRAHHHPYPSPSSSTDYTQRICMHAIAPARYDTHAHRARPSVACPR